MSIRSLLEDNLRRNPGRRFFLFRHDKQICERTYGEAGVRIARMAEVSASLGVRPRSAPVAIILDNGAVWIELYLAHASLAVPVVPVDPKLRPEEIAYLYGWIGKDRLAESVKKYGNSPYGKRLKAVLEDRVIF